MESYRNILFEPVIVEAKGQIARAGTEIRDKFVLCEVVAYAMNRLKPVFVATECDWNVQSKLLRIRSEEIGNIVRQAIVRVKRDPLRYPSDLPDEILESPIRSLFRLQNMLGRDGLMWRHVPSAIEEFLETAFANARSEPRGQRYYWQGANRKALHLKYSVEKTRNIIANSIPDKQLFEAYMLTASLCIVHVLEQTIIKTAQKRLERLPPSLSDHIRIEEIVAVVLNQLPPMYATTENGFKFFLFRAKTEIGSEIALIVNQAICDAINGLSPCLPPLVFQKFRLEREQAIAEVKQLFSYKHVTWQNLPDLLEEALIKARQGKVIWRQRHQNLVNNSNF